MTTSELIQTDEEDLGQLAISPDGSHIAYTTRSGIRRSALHLRSRDGQSLELARSENSVLADPFWRDADIIVFREVVDDEYLLRQIRMGDTKALAIGPTGGVVYGVVGQADSRTLVFVAATDMIPASIYRIPDAQTKEELLLRLDWISADTVIPHRRLVVDEEKEVVVYRYPSKGDVGAAIVWLHGGNNRFSPRWHSYAQFFAGAGFEFLALNYPEGWPRGNHSLVEQAQAAASLVRTLRKEGYRNIYLVGVSTGTQIIQEYLNQGLDHVDAVVEYSPINNESWQAPKLIPPLLAFSGGNDPLLDHEQRLTDIERYRKLGNSIDWVRYESEGHDLRGRKAVEDSMERTRDFLLDVRRKTSSGGHADVVEMPGFNEDPASIGRTGSPVVLPE